jgi:hypothetical protein
MYGSQEIDVGLNLLTNHFSFGFDIYAYSLEEEKTLHLKIVESMKLLLLDLQCDLRRE